MARYEQMLSSGSSTPAFTQTDLSGSARAASVQVQHESGTGAFEVVLEAWLARSDSGTNSRIQLSTFTPDVAPQGGDTTPDDGNIRGRGEARPDLVDDTFPCKGIKVIPLKGRNFAYTQHAAIRPPPARRKSAGAISREALQPAGYRRARVTDGYTLSLMRDPPWEGPQRYLATAPRSAEAPAL